MLATEFLANTNTEKKSYSNEIAQPRPHPTTTSKIKWSAPKHFFKLCRLCRRLLNITTTCNDHDQALSFRIFQLELNAVLTYSAGTSS